MYVDDELHNWRQVHIRGSIHDNGGIELTTHYETDPSEHPDTHTHVRLLDLNEDRGMATFRAILKEEEIVYRRLDRS